MARRLGRARRGGVVAAALLLSTAVACGGGAKEAAEKPTATPKPEVSVPVVSEDHSMPQPPKLTGGLAQADILIYAAKPLSASMVKKIEGLTVKGAKGKPEKAVHATELFSIASPSIQGQTYQIAAVDPATYRRFSLAGTEAEKANPWLLLLEDDPGSPVPVIADAGSMEYVLHRGLGDEMMIERPGGAPIRMRFVAALEDSVFQSELIMGERAFRRLFPGQEGYRVFLLDVPRPEEAEVVAGLESALADHGFDATTARDRLAGYHRVENTYLSTFQALGALGLVLGTVGLATVLLRNALERRREIALLRALGYRPAHVSGMLVAENATLLGLGVAAGIAAALVAVVPAVMHRGGALPVAAMAGVAAAVMVTGLVTSFLAAAVVRRSPLLAALRSE